MEKPAKPRPITGMSQPMLGACSIEELRHRQKLAIAFEGGPMFVGLPDRWHAARPTWRCVNGHVSHNFLKSEGLGRAACLACMGELVRTCPEDFEEDAPARTT